MATSVAQPTPPAPVPPKRKRLPEWAQVTITIVIFAALVFLSLQQQGATGLKSSLTPQRLWIVDFLLLAAFCLFLGLSIIGRPLGVLINDRNLMSLSRLQTLAWSLVILSAYALAAIQRVVHNVPDPLALNIDSNLWAVMGISLASLVGTPLILNPKKDKQPTNESISAAKKLLDDPEVDKNRQGTLYCNPDPSDAHLTDMFEGDEVGNTAYVDIAKLQMFIITLMVIGSYCSDLWHYFANSGFPATAQFPGLTSTQLALIGISHAGYLSSKTVSHTHAK
jgi:hypothetical protein